MWIQPRVLKVDGVTELLRSAETTRVTLEVFKRVDKFYLLLAECLQCEGHVTFNVRGLAQYVVLAARNWVSE